MHKPGHLTQEMRECIQNCLDCYKACLETVMHCLNRGGKHAGTEHIRLLQECANICNANTGFLITGSEFHSRTCEVCAEICDRCAEDCERFGDDEQMRACAEVCRRCAKSCRQMSEVRVKAA